MTGLRRTAVFQPEFIEDLPWWAETDRKLPLRVFDLIEAILRDPFNGIGKPEPLKYITLEAWSRQLNQEHRIAYQVREVYWFPASQVPLLIRGNNV